MIDETRRQRIRADKAEAELELLKNAVREMLDARIDRDGFAFVEAKDLVKRMIKGARPRQLHTTRPLSRP